MLCNRKSGGWATGMRLEQAKGGGVGSDGLVGVVKSSRHSRSRRVRSIPADTEERVGAVVPSRCVHCGPDG